MKHFIFDCDDVLLDWHKGFVAWLTENHMVPDSAGPVEWDLSHWLGCSQEKARQLVREFNASEKFGQLEAMPNADLVVWWLVGAGHTASVLTCCGSAASVRQARAANLLRELGDPFTHITILDLGESKFEALYQFSRNRDPRSLIFVEDNFTHAQAGVLNGIKSYCLRRSHNRAEEAANPDSAVIWIDQLHEILDGL